MYTGESLKDLILQHIILFTIIITQLVFLSDYYLNINTSVFELLAKKDKTHIRLLLTNCRSNRVDFRFFFKQNEKEK